METLLKVLRILQFFLGIFGAASATENYFALLPAEVTEDILLYAATQDNANQLPCICKQFDELVNTKRFTVTLLNKFNPIKARSPYHLAGIINTRGARKWLIKQFNQAESLDSFIHAIPLNTIMLSLRPFTYAIQSIKENPEEFLKGVAEYLNSHSEQSIFNEQVLAAFLATPATIAWLKKQEQVNPLLPVYFHAACEKRLGTIIKSNCEKLLFGSPHEIRFLNACFQTKNININEPLLNSLKSLTPLMKAVLSYNEQAIKALLAANVNREYKTTKDEIYTIKELIKKITIPAHSTVKDIADLIVQKGIYGESSKQLLELLEDKK